jgi:hypothetical protein
LEKFFWPLLAAGLLLALSYYSVLWTESLRLAVECGVWQSYCTSMCFGPTSVIRCAALPLDSAPQVPVVTPEKFVYGLRHTPDLAPRIGVLIFDEGHQFD